MTTGTLSGAIVVPGLHFYAPLLVILGLCLVWATLATLAMRATRRHVAILPSSYYTASDSLESGGVSEAESILSVEEIELTPKGRVVPSKPPDAQPEALIFGNAVDTCTTRKSRRCSNSSQGSDDALRRLGAPSKKSPSQKETALTFGNHKVLSDSFSARLQVSTRINDPVLKGQSQTQNLSTSPPESRTQRHVIEGGSRSMPFMGSGAEQRRGYGNVGNPLRRNTKIAHGSSVHKYADDSDSDNDNDSVLLF